MFCMNCGQQLPDGAKFCMTCGTPQGSVSPEKPVNSEPVVINDKRTFVPAMCPNCNAHMKVDSSNKTARCETCGTECLVQEAINNLSIRGNVQVNNATININRQYYLFTIVKWDKLSRPIEPREVGSRIMLTNLFLLQHSSQVPELYLNSETEYRMFYELKRRTEANVLNSNEIVEGIEVGDFIISFDEGEILLSSEGKIREKYAVLEFTKRPNLVFRRILDFISYHNDDTQNSILNSN